MAIGIHGGGRGALLCRLTVCGCNGVRVPQGLSDKKGVAMDRPSAPPPECQLKTFAAAALLSCVAVTPVFAQATIQEPGYFAQFYPNLDVLNGGAPTPAATLSPAAMQAYAERESGVGPAHFRATPPVRRSRR